jgi:diguanylate cyclase (GGDEF)-like protein
MMVKSALKSYSFFLAHLHENQRLHLLGAGALVIAFLLYYRWEWPTQAVWLGILSMGMIVPFSFFYRCIERSTWPVEKRYRRLVRTAFIQGGLDILLITVVMHQTGGHSSPIALLYILQLGAISVFFPSRQLVLLNLWAISLYTGVMQAYILGLLEPASLPLQGDLLGREFMPIIWAMYLFAMLANWMMIATHSRKVHTAWNSADEQNQYLDSLHGLARLGLEHEKLQNLHETLAAEIQKTLGADTIYITHWDEGNGQVHLNAITGKEKVNYLANPPVRRQETSLTLSVLRAGKHLVVRDVNCSPYLSPTVAQRFQEKSILALPLHGLPERRFLGALLVGYTETHDFSAEEIERARQLADVAALLISRTRLFHETQYRASLLEQMAGQITSLTSDLRRTTLLPSIVEAARGLLNAQRAALHLHDSQSRRMKCEYSVGLSDVYLETMSEKFESSPDAESFHEKRFVLIPDVLRDERTNTLRASIAREQFRAYAVFALESPQGSLGTLSLYWDEPHAISSADVSVGQLFAQRAGAMLHSASLYERVFEESLTDVLTDLPNRRYFERRLAEECERSKRYGHPFSLLMIDLDGFKAINDSFGHAIGDSVIQQVSAALLRTIRSSDMVARFGGDEFAIIVPEADKEAAIHLAEKIKTVLAATKLHLPNDTQRFVSACMGLAVYPRESDTLKSLFDLADQRMYRAKRTNTGTVIFDED